MGHIWSGTWYPNLKQIYIQYEYEEIKHFYCMRVQRYFTMMGTSPNMEFRQFYGGKSTLGWPTDGIPDVHWVDPSVHYPYISTMQDPTGDYDEYYYDVSAPSTYKFKATIKTPGANVPGLTNKEFVSAEYSSITNEGYDEVQAAVNSYTTPSLFLAFQFVGDIITEEENEKLQPAVVIDQPILRKSAENILYGGEEINFFIGGNVWQDMPSAKIGEITGNRQSNSLNMAGIQVALYDTVVSTSSPVAITTTDSEGEYGFQKLNPLHKYIVRFTYDGMRYENTIYDDNHGDHLNGVHSVAQEDGGERTSFNTMYSNIDSSPHNYPNGSWKKSYGLYQKIEDSSGNYIQYNSSGINGGSFRYYDALQIFKDIATNKNNNFNLSTEEDMYGTYLRVGVYDPYTNLEGEFKNYLRNNIGHSPSEAEINGIWTYIIDTLMTSSTIPYPDTDRFVLQDVNGRSSGTVIGYDHLYTASHDQSREVDFGLKLRTYADMWLSNDVYKATVLVNGKRQEYIYDKKTSETDSEGTWILNGSDGLYNFERGSDSSNRAGDDDYNGTQIYDRDIRKSEYLYDGSDTGSSAKNLQVFITYKISLKNQAQDIYTRVNEVLDYYDSNQYTYDPSKTIIQQNTFLGDKNGNKYYDITVDTNSMYSSKYGDMNGYFGQSENINGLFGYKTLFIRNIRSISQNNNNDLLAPSELTYIYITFQVNTDEATGKVKIDQSVEDLLEGNIVNFAGKKNIAEINGYSTFYNNDPQQVAGLMDLDSNPGSLKARDLNPDTGLIIASNNSWENRLQDDTDNSRNIALRIYDNEGEERSISGYTYEDARTKVVNDAVIGNGVYNPDDTDTLGNSDKKINGITVQLVELMQAVNDQGLSLGTYTGEYIWNSTYYSLKNNPQPNEDKWAKERDTSRYSSGTKQSKVVLQGPGIFEVTPRDLSTLYGDDLDGVYMFESLPPGDFYIRFIYGDTTETVLTNNTEDEVWQALNRENETDQAQIDENFSGEYIYDDAKGTDYGVGYGFLGTEGLNSKSYTGQDYKTTIYQNNVNQDPTKNFHVYRAGNDTYQGNDIVGYVSTSVQNYTRAFAGKEEYREDYKYRWYEADDENWVKAQKEQAARQSMYNYSWHYSDKDTKIDESNPNNNAPRIGLGISDAKDVLSYRQDEQEYSKGSKIEDDTLQTLKNHRAEVLASGTQLTTKAKNLFNGLDGKTVSLGEGTQAQREALTELMQNTRMVAQTGIINTQLEYDLQQGNVTMVYSREVDANGNRVNIEQRDQSEIFNLLDVDLGLTERPRAQLMLSNELTNIQIKLASGQILFDTTQTAHNLIYGDHKVYNDSDFYEGAALDENGYKTRPYMLRYDLMKEQEARHDELVEAYMDEELMYGATVRLTYTITLDNIGEVDYEDLDFYYKGIEYLQEYDSEFTNISKTNAIRVIDYVTNESNYDANYQGDVEDWAIITTQEILGLDSAEGENKSEDDDLVNNEFRDNLDTFNVLITTDKLSYDLIPRFIDPDTEGYSNSEREVKLVLSTLLANTIQDKNLVYANLMEILETTNTLGRRMYLSEAGNQRMPYQSENNAEDESTEWIHPDEIDADSSQKVQVSVPTGENKNFNRIIVVTILSLSIVIIAIVLIKKKVIDKH